MTMHHEILIRTEISSLSLKFSCETPNEPLNIFRTKKKDYANKNLNMMGTKYLQRKRSISLYDEACRS